MKTLPEKIAAWAKSVRTLDLKKTTRELYAGRLMLFSRHLEKRGLKHLEHIKTHHVEDYLQGLHASGVTAQTYNSHLTAIKRCFTDWNHLTNYINSLPLCPVENARRTLLTKQQIYSLLNSIGPHKAESIILQLALYTGARMSDIVRLRRSNVCLEQKTITYQIKKSSNGKEVVLPIHPKLYTPLKSWLDKHPLEQERLFPQEEALYLRNSGNISKRISRLFEKAGIKPTRQEGEGRKRRANQAGLHALRYYFVTHAQGDLKTVMELVGHNSPSTTMHYNQASFEQKMQAIANI